MKTSMHTHIEDELIVTVEKSENSGACISISDEKFYPTNNIYLSVDGLRSIRDEIERFLRDRDKEASDGRMDS